MYLLLFEKSLLGIVVNRVMDLATVGMTMVSHRRTNTLGYSPQSGTLALGGIWIVGLI